MFFLTLGAVACGLSSDLQIEQLFKNNRSQFETLKEMVNQDQLIVSFAPNYMRREGAFAVFEGRTPTKEESGMAEDRWAKYMMLMRHAKIAQIMKGTDGAVYFKIDRESFFNGDRGKGIIYSSRPLKPVFPKLEGYTPTADVTDGRGDYTVFKPLEQNWYVFLNGY